MPPETKVALVIPLYGFWSDLQTQELTAKVLQASLFRAKTEKHKLYYVFVAEAARVDDGVKNLLAGKGLGGNMLAVGVDKLSSYSEYLTEGIDAALTDTDATFIAVLNPWTIVREGAIDALVERLNKKDVAIVSGYDLRTHVDTAKAPSGVPASQLDTFQFNPPIEVRDFCSNFWGMTRQNAERVTIDVDYITQYFVARDTWQSSRHRGMEVISSQMLPIYSLQVDWKNIEQSTDYSTDMQLFMKKWTFDPQILF